MVGPDESSGILETGTLSALTYYEGWGTSTVAEEHVKDVRSHL
jgi:hypothetical protein